MGAYLDGPVQLKLAVSDQTVAKATQICSVFVYLHSFWKSPFDDEVLCSSPGIAKIYFVMLNLNNQYILIEEAILSKNLSFFDFNKVNLIQPACPEGHGSDNSI